MPYYNDPVAEIIDLFAYRARQERIQRQAEALTPQQHSYISSYARNMPWMPAGVNLSLSRADISPSDPRVEQIASLTAAVTQGFHLARQASEIESMGIDITPAQISRAARVQSRTALAGRMGSRIGGQLAQQTQEHQGQQLNEMGFRGLDSILQEHPELRGVVEQNRVAVKDNLPTQPRNSATRRGQAFSRIEEAFKRAGVPLPYTQYGKGWDDEEGRLAVQDPSGEVHYVDEKLYPQQEEPSGSGRFHGVGRVDLGSVLGFLGGGGGGEHRAPTIQDAAVQDALRQNGIPIDPENPFSVTSPIVRPGLMALDAPVQELQGQFRNVIGQVHGEHPDFWETQSDLGVMLTDPDMNPTSAGSGFFVDPESEVAQERRDRESKRGLIGGHNITIGRWLADTVTEPDTKPFLALSGVVDAGVQLFDPSTMALSKIGELRGARDAFEALDELHDGAGLVNGVRRGIHGPTASIWLNGPDGTKAIEALTNETSAARIWISMNRKVDPQLAARFAEASTTDDTRAILETVLGPRIRTKSEIEAVTKNLTRDWSTDPFLVRAAGNHLNPRLSQSRLLRWMPKGQADTYDVRSFATQIERHMINAKVPWELQEQVLNKVANSETRGGLLEAAIEAMGHEKGVLVQHGVSPERARQLTSLFKDNYESDVASFIDEIGDDVPVWTKAMAGGEMVDVPGPHLLVEHLGRYVPLPDARVIRRMTGNKALRFLTTTQGAEAFGQTRFPIAMMDFFTQEVWKTSTLLGRFPAWISRVVGESQLRMAAGGLDGMFSHPIDYFGYVAGKRGLVDPSGVALEDIDEFRNSLSVGHGGWLSRPGVVTSSRPVAIKKSLEFEGRYLEAWANELSELSYDPVSKFMLNNGIDDTERWLRVSEDGKKHLKFLQESHPGQLDTHAQLQDYLHSISRRVTIKTGGNTELIEALKAQKMADGTPLLHQLNKTNPKFRKTLTAHMDSGPDVVKGFDTTFKNAGTRFYDRYTRAVDRMFAMTMGFADNLWDRAPVFKQYLWQHTADLLPYADETARATILASAEKANLPSRMMKGLERAAKRGARQADTISAEELTQLARGYAADSAKKLLYDLNEKGQLADAARIIAPFGNAYQEIFGAWGKLLNDIGGPGVTGKIVGMSKLLRRSQQVIEGARGADFGALVGAPKDIDGTQMGFFMNDERGDEVFVIPGSQHLTQALSGVPVPLTGSVKGLNMIGNMVPGLGPVAAIPVAKMIQNKPGFQDLSDVLLPYGAPGDKNAGDVFNWMTYAPPWMRTAFNAASNGGYDQRTWANAQKDVMAYLYSTGKYDTTTRQGMNQLLDDAKDKARDLYFIKSFAQVGAPTSPSFRFLAQDKSGRLLAISALVDEYSDLKATNYDTADQLFLEQYGPNAILAVIPKSGSSTYGIPRTKEQHEFLLRHPDLRNNFPSTYGLFLPQDGEFDYDTYIDSFFQGDRQDLTPEQWLNLTNSMRGDFLYNQYKDKVGTRTDPAARAYLQQVRQMITDSYPAGPTGLSEKPDTDELINELYQAIDDPTVKDTDAGQGLALYLQYRDKAMAYALSIPGRSGFSRSRDTENVRIWLNNAAQRIIDRHPAFQFMWDIVLSREVKLEQQDLNEPEEQ